MVVIDYTNSYGEPFILLLLAETTPLK